MNEWPDLYPLKFHPIFKERIWGGQKLSEVLHKNIPEGSIGESWEISNVDDDQSLVSEGDLSGVALNILLERYGGDLLGEHNFNSFGHKFPLLIKFIDAQQPLSVQLHPNDQLAKERHDSFGKTEMWYIMDADDSAELILGFEPGIDKESYVSHLEHKSLSDILYSEEVQPGDSFFIQAGRVHAIGAGILLAEIQQTSDITYRIYDWDRVDHLGRSRELHTELAVDAIDFSLKTDCKLEYSRVPNTSNILAESPYFKTRFIPLSGKIEVLNVQDSFRILIGLKGRSITHWDNKEYTLNQGETMLMPACIKQFEIRSENAELLEVYI